MIICNQDRTELYRKKRNLEREIDTAINAQGFICLLHIVRIQQELLRVKHELQQAIHGAA